MSSTDIAPRGRVVTVFSNKGGAGRSMLASNLAVLLAERSTEPVALVDADLQFGDLAVMLKLAPDHTIADLAGAAGPFTEEQVRSRLTTHRPSGLLVLAAPLEPAYADQIGTADLRRILMALRVFCEFVIVDTPAYLSDVVLDLLEGSDDVVLVAGMDIPHLKDVRISVQTLRLMQFPIDRVHLVINRSDSKVRLDAADVERTLELKAVCSIPSDIVVTQSINAGTPVVTDAPRSGVARAIAQLADRFLSSAAPTSR